MTVNGPSVAVSMGRYGARVRARPRLTLRLLRFQPRGRSRLRGGRARDGARCSRPRHRARLRRRPVGLMGVLADAALAAGAR